jgi:tetratricopeptide (TPR) repeat protein
LPADRARQVALASYLNALGQMELSREGWEAARLHLEEARALLADSGAEALEVRSQILVGLHRAHWEEDREGPARSTWEEAIQVDRERASLQPDLWEPAEALILKLCHLATWDRSRRDWPRAEAGYREALARTRDWAAREPDHPAWVRSLGTVLNDFAFTLQQAGTPDPVRELLEEAIALERSTLARAPADRAALRGLAISLRNLGQAHLDAGTLASARAPLEEATALAQGLLEGEEDPRDLPFVLATILEVLGWLEWRLGRPVQACGHSGRALELLQAIGPEGRSARYQDVLATALAHAATLAGAPGEGAQAGGAHP